MLVEDVRADKCPRRTKRAAKFPGRRAALHKYSRYMDYRMAHVLGKAHVYISAPGLVWLGMNDSDSAQSACAVGGDEADHNKQIPQIIHTVAESIKTTTVDLSKIRSFFPSFLRLKWYAMEWEQIDELVILYTIIRVCSEEPRSVPGGTKPAADSARRVEGIPQQVSTPFGSCSMDRVANVFEQYTAVYDPTVLLDLLHRFQLLGLPNTLFADKALSSIQAQYDSPLISHSTAGMYTNSWIPLMIFIIKTHELKHGVTGKDWAVFINPHTSIRIDEELPSELKSSLQKNIEDLDKGIQRILLVMSITLDASLGNDGHASCLLILNTPSRGWVITLLDGLWVHSYVVTTNRFYIERLIEFREILTVCDKFKGKPMSIILSERCLQGVRAKIEPPPYDADSVWWAEKWADMFSAWERCGELCKTNSSIIIEHTELGVGWLSSLLSTAHEFNDGGSKAFICPYEAILYVIGFVSEEAPTHTNSAFCEAASVNAISNNVNHAFAVSILSGFCLLSEASVQRALYALDKTENYLIVVDGCSKPPSDVYTWAFRRESDGDVSVYALKNLEGTYFSFRWEACMRENTSRGETLAFLKEMIGTGNPDQALGEKRKRVDCEPEGEPKNDEVRSAYDIIVRVLRQLDF